jgi:3'-5' exonuclease
MKTLFLDIETIPTSQSLLDGPSQHADARADETVIKKMSLSALTGTILCLAYAVEPPEDSPVQLLSGDEASILTQFWNLAADVNLFVGHNVLDFDLRFIYQRSVINRIKPSREIPFSRFRSSPVFDTMHEWTKWGRDFVRLDVLAKALNIPSPKTEMDGSKVYDYYKAGRLDEIHKYCKGDVETVRKVYHFMTFTTP